MIWVFRDRSNDKLTFKEQWEVVKKGFAKGVKYDGCTASPDLDFGADCCGEHDAHYQLGDVSRAEADRNMRRCIAKKGYVVLPWVYWLGVRLGAGWKWKEYRNKNEETTGSSTDGLA
jgi:hypothetical protein